MSHFGYATTTKWTAVNRYTASGETPVRIGNPSRTALLVYTITISDTLPTLDPSLAMPVKPGEFADITLAGGERWWSACVDASDGAASLLE